MDTRTYWQQGPEAYREVKYQQAKEQRDADLEKRFAKVRAVTCNCELLDPVQCYADMHDTEIDDCHNCRCRCHKIADEQGLI